jgi:hypothetical protein
MVSNRAGGIAMRRSIINCVAAIALFAACSAVYAMYSVAKEGKWPQSWPKEMEPLRKQAQTYVGDFTYHYLIPFTKREQFEAAWPHILKIKSKGAPIILVRGPKRSFMQIEPAGVLIQTPGVGSKVPEEPIPAQSNPRATWMYTTFIELVVDGSIVDLNRIPLPADTPIIDERFNQPKVAADRAPAHSATTQDVNGSPPAAPASTR